MKKFGYTLAEVLIAVGIVGVIASVMLPMVNKFKPDSSKVIFLKTYDAIVSLTSSIVDNTEIYPIASTTMDYERAPLYNTSVAYLNGITEIGGDASKFCQILASGFSTIGNVGCHEPKMSINFSPEFTTVNNVAFMTSTVTTPKYQTDVYFDVNGVGKGNDCMYSAACPKPDRFKLMIAADGFIVPADPASRFYLKTRANWKLVDIKDDGKGIATALPTDIDPRPKAFEVEEDAEDGVEGEN